MNFVQPSIDPVIFSIGFIDIRWYSLAYIAGLILGLTIIKKLNKIRGLIVATKKLDNLFDKFAELTKLYTIKKRKDLLGKEFEPENKEEMWQINKALSKPTLANMVSGGRTPILSSDRLEEMGFSIGIHPALGFLAAGEALKNAYSKLDNTGNVDGIDLEDFDKFSRVMGFEDVWEFEKKWSGV